MTLDTPPDPSHARAQARARGLYSIGPAGSDRPPATPPAPALCLCRCCSDTGLMLSFARPRRLIPCEACQ